jgi:hypothetical protein
MAVKMILQDGPLAGEQQLVENLNTTPGYEMQFNIPNYQTFDAAGESVVGQGLVAVYSYLGPGPAPGGSDTWTSSSIYEFTGEYFVQPPGPVTPPGPLPLPPAVFLNALSGMTVNADDPAAGVQLVGLAGMTVDATTTSIGYATVALLAETVMSITRQSWSNVVSMSAQTTLQVTGSGPVNVLTAEDTSFEGGTTGDWTAALNCTIANSTAQAQDGTHSLAMTATAAGNMMVALPHAVSGISVIPGTTYTFRCGFFPAAQVRSVVAYIQWYNAAGTNINQSQASATEVAGQWVSVNATGVAPAGAVTVDLQAMVSSAAINGVHYIDLIEFFSH